MSPILKLEKDDEERELDFEIDYQLSLTLEQRFEMMFKKSEKIARILIENGHREPFRVFRGTKEKMRRKEKLYNPPVKSFEESFFTI